MSSISDLLIASDMNELKRSRFGHMLYNKHDQYVGYSFLHYGEFSQKEVELFDQIVTPSMIVLDVGANIGAHTVYFSQKVTNQGAVLAFEPQRIVFQNLCANMAINSIINTHCFHAAVGSSIGDITVPPLDYHREFNYGGLSLGQFQQGERVQVLTLDGLELSTCHFIKIDVEGMEREVLLGGQNLIKKCRPIIYAENDRAEKSADLIRLFFELGYKLYWHLPPLYNPDNYFKNPINIFGNTVSVNMLCIPEERQVEINGLRAVAGPDDSWQR